MSYKFNEYQLKWLEAMKNGNFKQTESRFLDDDGYDCFGVACSANGISDDLLYNVKTFEENILLMDMRDKLGLIDNDGSFTVMEVIDGILVGSILQLNDVMFFSFPMIAEYIENNPENIFVVENSLESC